MAKETMNPTGNRQRERIRRDRVQGSGEMNAKATTCVNGAERALAQNQPFVSL
jgi:hypothetical protein